MTTIFVRAGRGKDAHIADRTGTKTLCGKGDVAPLGQNIKRASCLRCRDSKRV